MRRSVFDHESAYRGRDVSSISGVPIVICGAGAIGSQVAEAIVRQWGVLNLTVIDHDRVEQHNIGNQIYREPDVGRLKTAALADHLFDILGIEVQQVSSRLDGPMVRRWRRKGQVVVDCFDNSESRRLVAHHCDGLLIPCLHLGVAADYGEVIWNDRYRVPTDAPPAAAAAAPCHIPLARTIIALTATVGAEVLARYLLDGVQEDYTITLGDFQIRRSNA